MAQPMSISPQEFSERRARLIEQMAPNSIAIVPAAREVIRNGDAHYPFRQHSDFYYLSGCDEPDALLVLLAEPASAQSPKTGRSILFCRAKNPHEELWHGRRVGWENASQVYGVDDGFAIDIIDDKLPELLSDRIQLYYTIGCNKDWDDRVTQALNQVRAKVRRGANCPQQLMNLDTLLHEMRLHKSTAEIAIMRRAAKLSAQAQIRAMQACRPGRNEYHLEAEIQHQFASHGARFAAYSPIVGGGDNGCILHYTDNNATLTAGDLVLIDAGCELQYYAADITRTFPVNGHFSAEQKALYELVLTAQQAAIDVVKPGNHCHQPHQAAVQVITEGLVTLGLLTGDINTLIETGAYKAFYMHGTGHWLGMDVHDVGNYKIDGQWRTLQPGMVMTVEPGIYIAANNTAVAEKWRGIGIRIEDDVLVTKDGCEILSIDAPKTVADIEAVMQ